MICVFHMKNYMYMDIVSVFVSFHPSVALYIFLVYALLRFMNYMQKLHVFLFFLCFSNFCLQITINPTKF